jgi:hypothetical protein
MLVDSSAFFVQTSMLGKMMFDLNKELERAATSYKLQVLEHLRKSATTQSHTSLKGKTNKRAMIPESKDD